jgi:uncharacterized membrane-anchored protein YitT (DUF2179 family)
MSKTISKKDINEYGLVTIGFILVAVALEYFFIPNDLAAGGVGGLAIVINYYIPSLSTSISILIMNVILFIVAFIFIGGNFGAKTIYASFGLSGAMWVMEKLFSPAALTNDLFIASIFGSLITSLGLAMVFNVNASTGGTDILAKILNKFFNTDMGKSLLIVDFIVTLVAGITFGINKAFYAMFVVILNGIIIDRFIAGWNISNSITIVSEKNKKIRNFIINDLNRGCTFLNGKGGYTDNNVEVLYTVLERNEFIRLKTFIKENDPCAFITVGETYEVLGEGFKKLEQKA